MFPWLVKCYVTDCNEFFSTFLAAVVSSASVWSTLLNTTSPRDGVTWSRKYTPTWPLTSRTPGSALFSLSTNSPRSTGKRWRCTLHFIKRREKIESSENGIQITYNIQRAGKIQRVSIYDNLLDIPRPTCMKLGTGGFYQPMQSDMCKQGSYMWFA